MSVIPIKKTSHYDNSKKNYGSRSKPYFEPNDLRKLGYIVDQLTESKYRINGFLEIDINSLKFTDYLKNITNYLFTNQELNQSHPSINAAIRKITKSQ